MLMAWQGGGTAALVRGLFVCRNAANALDSAWGQGDAHVCCGWQGESWVVRSLGLHFAPVVLLAFYSSGRQVQELSFSWGRRLLHLLRNCVCGLVFDTGVLVAGDAGKYAILGLQDRCISRAVMREHWSTYCILARSICCMRKVSWPKALLVGGIAGKAGRRKLVAAHFHRVVP